MILLILAGITINYLIGDNGILRLAQRAKEEYEKSAEEEQKWLDSLLEELEESDKKIAIRIINKKGDSLVNSKLNVYTDKACQNLLKEISIDANSSTNSRYSYESDDVLQNGIYYIKMAQAPTGYELNRIIFEFQIEDGKNVLTIPTSKKISEVTPSTYGGAYATGEEILMSEMINIKVEFPNNLTENLSGQMLIEPIAEYDQAKGKYIYLEKFTQDNLEPIPAFMHETMDDNTDYWAFSQQIAESMQNRDYSISVPITNGVAEVQGNLAKYAYLVTIKDLDRNDDLTYGSYSWVVRPGYEIYGGVLKNYIVHVPLGGEVQTRNLKIVTNVGTNYESTKEAIFVYRVEAVYGAKTVFSDVVTANVKNNGNNEIIVDGIFPNSTVTVSLEYCPPGYKLTSAKETQITMNSGEAKVNYEYTGASSVRKSRVAVQKFLKNDGDGSWDIEKEEITDEPINLMVEVNEMTIHAIIDNNDTLPYFIRMKALAPTDIELTGNTPYGKWTNGNDGYWYYDDVLEDGGRTELLDYKIDNFEEMEAFNIPIIIEYTPVQYDASGKPFANWD